MENVMYRRLTCIAAGLAAVALVPPNDAGFTATPRAPADDGTGEAKPVVFANTKHPGTVVVLGRTTGGNTTAMARHAMAMDDDVGISSA